MAKKPTVNPVGNVPNNATAINNNLNNLADGFENTLSLDGSIPNAMGADLDLNNNDILNAGALNAATVVVDGVNLTTQVTNTSASAAAALVSQTAALVSQNAAALSAGSVALLYDTVADLLASTEVSRGTGSIWEGGGFRYIEVASGGDITNSAGTPVELDALSGEIGVSVEQFGDITLSATIDAALASSVNTVIFPTGTYPSYTFAASNKTVYFQDSVTFKLEDGTSGVSDTTPFSALHITGSGNSFFGDVIIDGNAANNSNASTDTSDMQGAFSVQGNDNSWVGEVEILDAYWVGYSIGSDDTTVCNNYSHTGVLRIKANDHYAFAPWSCNNWNVDTIISENTTQGLANRVRTGTQSLSTKTCKNGKINTIQGSGLYGVFEVGTEDLLIDSINIAGWKAEGCSGLNFGKSISDGITIDAYGFALLGVSDSTFGDLIVKNFAGTPTVDSAVLIGSTGLARVSIGSIFVHDTQNNSNDIKMRDAQDVNIGSIICMTPQGTGHGFFFDYDATYAPQERIIIGSILSQGHTTGNDIEIENYGVTDIEIGLVNPDATINASAAALLNRGIYREGTINATLVPSTSGTITLNQSALAWTRRGRVVDIQGRMRVSALSSPVGTVELTNLPFTVATLSSEAEISVPSLFGSGFTAGALGSIVGETVSATTKMRIYAQADETFVDISTRLAVNTIIRFQLTYVTDD